MIKHAQGEEIGFLTSSRHNLFRLSCPLTILRSFNAFLSPLNTYPSPFSITY